MKKTLLHKTDTLPLTCSRKGSCCFDKTVFINPFELAHLANAKKTTISNFIRINCEPGGIQLKFDDFKNKKGQHACSLYMENFGCSIHKGRPLACRLYPIGRQIQNNISQYIYEGETFPCLTDCKEVLDLPRLTVEEYLKEQQTRLFENVQNGYLEVMQNMADIAFTLLLDTGLANSGDTDTLRNWRKMSQYNAAQLSNCISNEWLNTLLQPDLNLNIQNFVEMHNEIIQEKAQAQFETLSSFESIKNLAIEIMAITLLLGKSIGAESKSLVDMWIEVALENGAKI